MKASARTSGWAIVGLIAGLAFCREAPEQPQAKLAPLQPNRSSELAIAMRSMDGELVSLLARHAEEDNWDGAALTLLDLTRMMPTDSSMLVDGYRAYAMAFGKHIEVFNAAPSADTYSNVVNGCLSCHVQACPGPIERINKRQLN